MKQVVINVSGLSETDKSPFNKAGPACHICLLSIPGTFPQTVTDKIDYLLLQLYKPQQPSSVSAKRPLFCPPKVPPPDVALSNGPGTISQLWVKHKLWLLLHVYSILSIKIFWRVKWAIKIFICLKNLVMHKSCDITQHKSLSRFTRRPTFIQTSQSQANVPNGHNFSATMEMQTATCQNWLLVAGCLVEKGQKLLARWFHSLCNTTLLHLLAFGGEHDLEWQKVKKINKLKKAHAGTRWRI